MVQGVVLLQLLEPCVLPIEMVQTVMAQVIAQISYHEARKESRDPLRAQYEFETEIEQECQWHAHARNHDQSEPVARIVVMHTVENEVHSLTEIGRGNPMEHEPVQCVFGKAPYKHSERKQPGYIGPSQMFHRNGAVKEIAEYRHEDDEWDAPMDPRELVDEIALEHSRTLVLVVYVKFLSHSVGLVGRHRGVGHWRPVYVS